MSYRLKKTGRARVYSVEIAQGKPALQIALSDKKPSSSFQSPSYDDIKLESVIPSVISETYQGIVDFGDDHDPIYISISKNLSLDDEKKEIENIKLDWEIHHPIEAAEINLELALREYEESINEVVVKQKLLHEARRTPEALAFVDAKLHPLKININKPGFSYTDIIDTKEKLSFLMGRGARAYVWDYLGYSHIEAPTKEGLDFARSIRDETLNIFEAVRRQILQGQQSIEDAENNLALAEKNKNKAEEKKKKAQDKKDKEDKRKKTGTATGKGKKVGDKWLEDAGKESGVPIPDRIADKLRGKEFKDFDEFRKEFWKAVANDAELRKKFSKGNQGLIDKGFAPYPIPEEQVGGRDTFELHHETPISEGGGVYDMDNIRVTTPKRHIDIHRGK